ncbi:MAG: restriction endonuclease subunit S [Gammaproteobacteria bacterium]|nr:restriction endonuclease subunit S [Gammaproteobacteria bacterium]MDE0415051.1 restriction endonuclease subunit S [Gammaproteobacteria bacterium]
MTATNDLPTGWATSSVGELGHYRNGRAFKPSEWRTKGSPIIRIQNLNDKSAEFNCSNKQHDEKFKVRNGDLLYAWSASLGAYIWRGGDAWLNQHIFRVDHDAGIDRLFLYYALTHITAELYAKAHGSGMVHVTKKKFEETPLRLPPFNEQRRIVAKTEELLSELDKGVENLEKVREQLSVYLQAVLKHAFEGKLTAQWREENKDKLEDREQLLARIKQTWEARYEKQLAAWEALLIAWEASGRPGKKPSRPRRKSELPRLVSGENAKLPRLPEGYVYTYLSNLGELGRGKSKHRPRNAPELFGGAYPFVQTGDVKAAGREIRKYSKTYSDFGLKQSKLWPKGTLCITIAANIAETAFLGFDGCFPDSVVGFHAAGSLVLPAYVEFFIKSVRARIEAYAPATAQKNINLTTLENLIVPLCSLPEQQAIVNRLEASFSTIEQEKETIDEQLRRVVALRQSILKKAISGQLVAQDPNDESALVLLERIKAEKERARNSRDSMRKTEAKRALT